MGSYKMGLLEVSLLSVVQAQLGAQTGMIADTYASLLEDTAGEMIDGLDTEDIDDLGSNIEALYDALLAEEEEESSDGFKTLEDGKTWPVFFNMADMETYGCFCHFEKHTFNKGKGNPVDQYDRLCQIYHHGVICLAMDHGKHCNPWKVDYKLVVLSQENKKIDCVSMNGGDQCKIDLCNIETHLVMDTSLLHTDILNEPEDYPQHKKYNPNHPEFEEGHYTCPERKCKTQECNGGDEIQCCGEYHIRWPFKTLNGNKQCCDYDNGDYGLRTYNILTHKCDDGTIKLLGQL